MYLAELLGGPNVVAFYLGITEKVDPSLLRVSFAQANGHPAIVSILSVALPRIAPITVGAMLLGDDGRIATIVQQSATRKLSCFV